MFLRPARICCDNPRNVKFKVLSIGIQFEFYGGKREVFDQLCTFRGSRNDDNGYEARKDSRPATIRDRRSMWGVGYCVAQVSRGWPL